MIAAVFGLLIQGEGKTNLFFAHKSLLKSHLQGQCRNLFFFAEFVSLRAFS
jgi:hypothetical protein